MKKTIFSFVLFISSLILAGTPKFPKNIIIMIGDGMGVSQVSVSVLTNPNSSFKRFPVTGFSITCSADKLKTDSAAGGTALACGESTNNGSLGVDKSGKPIQSILDLAKQKKLSTGIVVTSEIINATPAAFLGHTTNRHESELLAQQFTESETDIVIGGGKKYFVPDSLGGKRTDNQNLLAKLVRSGYEIISSYEELVKSNAQKYYALLEPSDLKAANQRSYSLSELTQKALAGLSKNENGFVMMIEGSQIDHGGHENLPDVLISEMNDFEKAVKTALEFAEADKNTLVLVTADHETGGAAITGGKLDGGNMKIVFASKSHTAAMVGVFAFGPSCEMFSGVNENYKIGRKLLMLLNAQHFSNSGE